jgi:hypothetical protein
VCVTRDLIRTFPQLEVENVATPAESVAVPRLFPPSLNVTFPVGVPEPVTVTDGCPFLVIQYIDGVSLREELQQGAGPRTDRAPAARPRVRLERRARGGRSASRRQAGKHQAAAVRRRQ